MGYYKIRNLTKNLPKRDKNKDITIDIVLAKKYMKESFKLGTNDTLYLELDTIPVALHKYRMKQFISISEISQNEFLKHSTNVKIPVKNKNTVKPISVDEKSKIVVDEKKITKPSTKKSYKK